MRKTCKRKTEEPQVEQKPSPPPLGGGENLFWGEKTKLGLVRRFVAGQGAG